MLAIDNVVCASLFKNLFVLVCFSFHKCVSWCLLFKLRRFSALFLFVLTAGNGCSFGFYTCVGPISRTMVTKIRECSHCTKLLQITVK